VQFRGCGPARLLNSYSIRCNFKSRRALAAQAKLLCLSFSLSLQSVRVDWTVLLPQTSTALVRSGCECRCWPDKGQSEGATLPFSSAVKPLVNQRKLNGRVGERTEPLPRSCVFGLCLHFCFPSSFFLWVCVAQESARCWLNRAVIPLVVVVIGSFRV